MAAERRSWMRISTVPRSRALPNKLRDAKCSTMSGKIVSTSMRMSLRFPLCRGPLGPSLAARAAQVLVEQPLRRVDVDALVGREFDGEAQRHERARVEHQQIARRVRLHLDDASALDAVLVDHHRTDEIVHPPLAGVVDGIGVERGAVQTIGVGAIVDADEAHDETTEMWLRGFDGQRRVIGGEHSIGVQTRADIELVRGDWS